MTEKQLSMEELSRLAKQVGLHDVAVTDTSPFPELIPHLEAYAERGTTGFEAADINHRINPLHWLPSAKSIIVAAIPYLTAESDKKMKTHPKGHTHGNVSVYAYGEDYHNVFTRRFRELHQVLELHLGTTVEARVAVDTSPLVDRRIGERAGLGWIGKNSMFYSDTYGSYVFLGAMLVDVVIDSEGREQEDIGKHCGTCELCLKACPTGAIISPGVIDATRCLSYVTQMKGTIPLEFREKLGRRVWGCDVCQRACPVNRTVQVANEAPFVPEDELAYPDLIAMLSMSNRQFNRQYGHTAIAWRGLPTLKRNALIALGNARNRDAVAHIKPFLAHARTELRASAAWSLGRIGGDEALTSIKHALEVESDPDVVEELEMGVRACEA